MDKLIKLQQNKSLLCVGLDSDFNQLPDRFKKMDHPQFEFNKWIIDQTHQYVCAFKPNSAYYEARGAQGIAELQMTFHYLRDNYPNIFTILDFKRADIGHTNQGYCEYAFEYLQADAITVQPYPGQEALRLFLDYKDKAIIVWCRTSNPGAGEFQDLVVKTGQQIKPVWQIVAEQVSRQWNKNHNCMLVVGATYPKELAQVRQIVEDMTILVPGIGVQGGDLAATLKAGLTSTGKGLIINSSRGIIFSPDPAQAAQELYQDIINKRNNG